MKLRLKSILKENFNFSEEEIDDMRQDKEDEMDFDSNEEETDDWNAPESDDSEEFEKEPAAKDVAGQEKSLVGIHKKQAELKALEDKKDSLLMQLKSDILTLDQYKEAIGNIPMQIKKLRSDIENAMNVSADDGEELA